MKRNITLVSLLALFIGLCSAFMLAQSTGTLKGTAKDEAGKPIPDATIEFTNSETGRKVVLKTDKKGEYFSVGVPPGTYNAALSVNGKVIDQISRIPVALNEERIVNFDLAKDNKGGVSEEQRQKIEAAKKENEKIGNLNTALKQAKDLETANQWDQAIATLQPLAEQNPDKDLLWAYLADAYRGAKKYPEAADAYQKALAIKPMSGAYHNGLADAYAKSGQTDKAIAEYNNAVQAEPANAAMYYFNEGAVLTNQGKLDEAIAAFDKTIQADPTRADAYYWKGVNMLGKATTKGDKMVAPPGTEEAFNKYLELAPDGKYAQATKDMLASMGASVQTSYGKGKTASKTPPKK
jgi:tetratricopeptide (TPR) repeat protein